MKRSILHVQRSIAVALATAMLMGAAAHAAEPAAENPAELAATFEKQAADFRAMAERHENMAKMHHAGAGNPKMNHESMVRHCSKIAEDLRAAAKESEAAAAEARKSAQKP